jgi:hypothetical protein
MTKILNLDTIQTKRDKAIILGGVEHVMKTLTVKEYIYHMKQAETLSKLGEDSIDTLSAGLAATVNILTNAFPTVLREQFEDLSMEQLEAIRELVDSSNDEVVEDTDKSGETEGEVA